MARAERPLNPDDLPLESEQTDEERRLVEDLRLGSPMPAAQADADGTRERRRTRGRLPGLRAITGRVRGGTAAGTDR